MPAVSLACCHCPLIAVFCEWCCTLGLFWPGPSACTGVVCSRVKWLEWESEPPSPRPLFLTGKRWLVPSGMEESPFLKWKSSSILGSYSCVRDCITAANVPVKQRNLPWHWERPCWANLVPNKDHNQKVFSSFHVWSTALLVVIV